MTYTIRSDQPISLTLCENDRTKSIMQNLSMLLSTRKGTIPMYRDFGLSQSFLDKPLEVAQVLLFAEVQDAVAAFEPRATVVSVRIDNSGNTGKAVTILEVEL